MDFGWHDVRTHPHVPNGSYASTAFNQHSMGWCGCCYIVAVVQAVEDRGHIAHPCDVRHTVDMQTVVNHFNTSASEEDDAQWNACHGGFPEHVVECLMSGVCPLVTTHHKRWLGYPLRTEKTPLGTAPYRVTGVKRIPTRDVMDEIYQRGPIVLEINAQTLKSCDREGVVTDHAPNTSNHAVAVIGWKQTHAGPSWIVRNSWGQNRVPVTIPDDVLCVNEDGNRCEVDWEYWTGDPNLSGFCYLPMSHPSLHMSDPWIVPIVT